MAVTSMRISIWDKAKSLVRSSRKVSDNTSSISTNNAEAQDSWPSVLVEMDEVLLLNFPRNQFGLDVVGVEMDELFSVLKDDVLD
ncbi:hypothetical protein Dimus_036291 [Dionaea muscipula]